MLVANAAANAKAQPGQRVRIVLEGFEEQTTCIFEIIVRIGGRRITAIHGTVEYADGITDFTVGKLALQLHADVAVRRQLAGQRTLDFRQCR